MWAIHEGEHKHEQMIQLAREKEVLQAQIVQLTHERDDAREAAKIRHQGWIMANNNANYVVSKNHKRANEAGASQSEALVKSKAPFQGSFHPSASAAKFHPPQKKNPGKTRFRKAFTVALPKGTTSQGNSKVPPSNMPCFNCNKPGH